MAAVPHIFVRYFGWVIISAMLVENKKAFFLKGLLAVFILGFAGCNIDQTATQVKATKTAELLPYITPTPSQTPNLKFPSLISPTQLPNPTPTPVIYTIVEGDTMLAIALRHGISLEELQAANPEVNARLLVVDTELIIPLGAILPSDPVTATPIPINVTSTNCYSVPDGIWCFISVKNDRNRPLESLSARVVLSDDSGAYIADDTAIGALNVLPIGEELPLVVFFPGKFPFGINAAANVLTVQPVPRNDDRYLNAWLELDDVVISEGGERAEVLGRIGIPAKSQPGNLTWILVVAYDSEGNVVGVRKIEQFGLFDPGTSREFSIEVFSLDSIMSDVRAFVEMRPISTSE